MSKSKTTICKVCGAEIASSAKVCPKCGAKIKKPVYKRVWFWVLIVIVIIAVAAMGNDSGSSDSSSTGSSSKSSVQSEQSTSKKSESKPKEKKRVYKAVKASRLQKALEDNAAAASDRFKGRYLAVSGPFQSIDSDGAYMTIASDEYGISSIMCDFKNDAQVRKAKKLHKGQIITVKGKMTDVGEVLGYTMEIDSFK